MELRHLLEEETRKLDRLVHEQGVHVLGFCELPVHSESGLTGFLEALASAETMPCVDFLSLGSHVSPPDFSNQPIDLSPILSKLPSLRTLWLYDFIYQTTPIVDYLADNTTLNTLCLNDPTFDDDCCSTIVTALWATILFQKWK